MSARVVAALRPFKSRNYEGVVEAGTTVSEMLIGIGAAEAGLEYYVSIDTKPIDHAFWDARKIADDELVCVRAMASGGGGEHGKNPAAVIGNLLVGAAAFAIPGGPGFWVGMAKMGTVAGGGWLVGKLAPAPEQGKFPGGESSGTNLGNALAPYSTVPYVCGTSRFYPPHAAFAWHDAQNKQTVALYTLGPGPLKIDTSTLSFGDKLISNISGITSDMWEVREGKTADDDRTIYPPLIFNNTVDHTLEEGIYSPAGVFTAFEANEAVFELRFPTGIWAPPTTGNRRYATLQFSIRARLEGTQMWYENVTISGPSGGILGGNSNVSRAEAFRIVLTGVDEPYQSPGTGRWELGIRYDDITSPSGFDSQVIFHILTTYHREDPITEDGVASFGIRIPDGTDAGDTGSFNQFNVIASRIVPLWIGEPTNDWETYAVAEANNVSSSNPAAIVRDIMAGPGNARRLDFLAEDPLPEITVIDEDGLGEFYKRCDDTPVAFTDLESTMASGWLTVTSAIGGFLGLLGQYLEITAGTNFDAGSYLITDVASTNTITISDACGRTGDATVGVGSITQGMGWTFDGIFDKRSTLFQECRTVAAVGRASFGVNDGFYGVVMDKDNVTDVPVQAFGPRNSSDASSSKVFQSEFHGYKMQFINAGQSYLHDETFAYADGFDNTNSSKFERLEAFGITDPRSVRDYGRYRIEDATLRPEIHQRTVDAEGLICTRGDVVAVSDDFLEIGSGSARIREITEVAGDAVSVVVDEKFEAPTGHLGCRIRYLSGTDVVFVTRECTHSHTSDNLSNIDFSGDPIVGNPLAVDDMLQFGNLDSETSLQVVTKIEPMPGLKFRLTLVDHAPGVHTLYSWEAHDSRITVPPVVSKQAPAIPEILEVQSDETVLEVGQDGSLVSRIVVSIVHPSGFDSDNPGAPLPPYARANAVQLQYRTHDDTTPPPWVTVTFDGQVDFVVATDVTDGVLYDLRVRAVSESNVASAWSAIREHTVVGKLSRPDAPTDLALEEDILRWVYENPPLDLGGFEVRQHFGDNASWENATPLHSGLISQTFHKVPVLSGGVRVFFVKAVDTRYPAEAAYSATAASLGMELPESDLLNIDNTRSVDVQDPLGTGPPWWPTTSIINGSIVGDEIHADTTGSVDLFWGSGDDPFWGTGDFWPAPAGDSYDEMYVGYVLALTGLAASADNLEFFVNTEYSASGESHKIEYGIAPLGSTPLIPWTGRIRLTPSMADVLGTINVVFRITTSGGLVQGKVTAFNVWVTYPDLEERIIGHNTGPAPIALPEAKTYTTVEVLHAQITAGTAIAWTIASKVPGNLSFNTYAAGGGTAAATVDAYIKGYRALT